MGRWSENEESIRRDLEIGTSCETGNRSKIELEAPEQRVGWEIGCVREWEVMKFWNALE